MAYGKVQTSVIGGKVGGNKPLVIKKIKPYPETAQKMSRPDFTIPQDHMPAGKVTGKAPKV